MFIRSKWMFVVITLTSLCGISGAEICGTLSQVSAGEDHSLVLTKDGSLLACGSNGLYQLGLGQNSSYKTLTLQKVKGINNDGFLQGVTCFDAGWYHSLAVSNGTLVSWGTNSNGQLGNDTPISIYSYTNVPQKVKGIGGSGNLSDTKNIVYVSAGRSGTHSLVVDSNGYVYSFGNNSDGQCGINNTNSPLQYPHQVVGENHTGLLGGPGNKIVAVEAGVDHSLALSDSNSGGYVYEWGYNNGSTYPQKVLNYQGGIGIYLRHIKGISSCYHSVAVDSNGYVYEWMYSSQSPCKIPEANGHGSLSNIKMVAAGNGDYYYSMALGNDGRVWIWSLGGNPSLVADGDMHTQSGYLENITTIAFGYYDHKLAIDNQGYGWAWGSYNGDGEFGVGDNDTHPTPVKMFYPVPDPNVWNKTQNTYYTTIQAAINGSNSNDIIVVYPGVYCENVNFDSKQLTLESSDPNDPSIVAQTIINGSGGNTVTFTNNNSTINGFTITNGSSWSLLLRSSNHQKLCYSG